MSKTRLWNRLALAAAVVAVSAAPALANSIAVPNGTGGGQCGAGNANTARFAGNCGALVTIAAADATPAYVQENNPSAETAYRVRLNLNTRSLTMSSGDSFDAFAAYDGADPAAGAASGNAAIRLEIQQADASTRQLQFFVRQDGGTEVSSPAFTFRRGWASLEFQWQRSSGVGNNDGVLNWWYNGFSQTGISNIDNDTEVVNYARWGAVSGIDAGTQGTFKLDDFASQRSGYIGPAFPFSDVSTGSPQWPHIQAVYGAEIMPEASVGTFNPTGNVTRKEMVKWMVISRPPSAAPYTPPACTASPYFIAHGAFADVPCPDVSNPYVDYIYEAATRGITAGCGGGNFCPNGIVNRGEMAVFLMIARAIAIVSTCPPSSFADVDPGSPFCPYIKEAVLRGVTVGCGGGNYCPNQPVLRGEMAVFIRQTFNNFPDPNRTVGLTQLGP